MKIFKVSRSGKSFRVRLEDGRRGYVSVEDVDLGPKRMHREPVAQPTEVGASSGVVGSGAFGE